MTRRTLAGRADMVFLLRNRHAPTEAAQFRERVVSFLVQFERGAHKLGAAPEDVFAAKFAFVALIDELALSPQLNLRNSWEPGAAKGIGRDRSQRARGQFVRVLRSNVNSGAALPTTIPRMLAPEAAPDELRVTAPAEIAAYLQQLLREDANVRLSGPQGDSLTSRIVALDAEADLIGLALGADPDGISQALVAQGEITAVAYLGAIKLQFDLDAPVLVSGEQGTVLRGALPAGLYRFQRRQFFRVQPAGSTFPRIVLPGGTAHGRALRVLDISIGGLALALPADLSADLPALVPGQVLAGLVLELDRTSALQIALLPHHVHPISGDATGMQQLGGAFVDLDAAAARTLQVYVDQTQKRRRLLKLDP